jgi:hypothetical protein
VIELKLCPFCGGKCCVCSINDLYRAHCMDCDCQISTNKNNDVFETAEEATEAWNTRNRGIG